MKAKLVLLIMIFMAGAGAKADEELDNALGDLGEDFSHSVPEPQVKQSPLAGLKTSRVWDSRPPIKNHKAKVAKTTHAKAHKKSISIAKAKHSSKKFRAIASTAKARKKHKILAKNASHLRRKTRKI